MFQRATAVNHTPAFNTADDAVNSLDVSGGQGPMSRMESAAVMYWTGLGLVEAPWSIKSCARSRYPYRDVRSSVRLAWVRIRSRSSSSRVTSTRPHCEAACNRMKLFSSQEFMPASEPRSITRSLRGWR